MNACYVCVPPVEVRQVEMAKLAPLLLVDAVQHPAGTVAVRSLSGSYYGYYLRSVAENPRPGYTRHRLHRHREAPR